ncbi:PIR protein, putative [Plasmodium sp.]|nr:PIR protein, putative [Plasmodium sp.]
MKLHYSKILFFSLPLNILEHNNNKPYITPHTSTTTSRVLRECDLYMPKYDNDADMKSVKENFDRQTSQRFEEYEERMITQRKKCKEQCDKDIQQIIVKDKIENSLAEKVEKGCLRCGCGLGGVAAGVGIFGSLGTYGWKVAATATAIEAAKEAGIKAGIEEAIVKLKGLSFISSKLPLVEWLNFINRSNYKSIPGLAKAVKDAVTTTGSSCPNHGGPMDRVCNALNGPYEWFPSVAEAGEQAAAGATSAAEKAELFKVTTTSSNAYSAIGYSVLAILIIVLVIVIIYLILRYRRKKKLNKKAQYTKLLNQ